jgi:predicted nucleic acid-binding protein
MKHVLIDSDVVLDMLLDRQPFSTFSTEVFILCEKNEMKGYTTPVIIANVYYILRKKHTKNDVKYAISRLLDILDIVQINKEIIFEALNSDLKDFEDALQNFSAVKNGKIDTIITRNTKDYQRSTLAVYTPEMYLK